MECQHSGGGCRPSTAPVNALLRGGHSLEPTSCNMAVLSTDLILKIFLLSDGKIIGRGRCMSRDWHNMLTRADNMVTRLTFKGEKGVVFHLDNPLKEVDCGRLSLYLFDTRVELPVAAPVLWKWFSLVGSAMGKLCARYSVDGRSSSLVIWNPLSRWRSLIPDPGSDCYHFNHRDDWSAYAFVGVDGCDDYRIVSLIKRHLASAGYDMKVFNSAAGQWSPGVRTPAMVDRLSNQYAVSKHYVFWVNSEGRFWKKPISVVRYSTVDSTWNEIEIGADVCVEHPTLIGREDSVDFVSYEHSSARFGLHLVIIKIGPFGGMEWGRHLFIGDPNMTNTPCAMFGRDLFGISHFIHGFDVLDPSFDAAVSEAQFRAIGLVDGVVGFVGRIRWAGVVPMKDIIEFCACG